LPEEWLIERNQQVGATPRKTFSPSSSALWATFAAIFRDLRYILVTIRSFAGFTSTSKALAVFGMEINNLTKSLRTFVVLGFLYASTAARAYGNCTADARGKGSPHWADTSGLFSLVHQWALGGLRLVLVSPLDASKISRALADSGVFGVPVSGLAPEPIVAVPLVT
jgi:hypothetical protein